MKSTPSTSTAPRSGGSGHKIRLRFRILGNNDEEYTLSLFANEKVIAISFNRCCLDKIRLTKVI